MILVKVITAPKKNQQFHTYSVVSSHLYIYDDQPNMLLLAYPGGAEERVVLNPGDTVYTMNDQGKTMDKFIVPGDPNAAPACGGLDFWEPAFDAWKGLLKSSRDYTAAKAREKWCSLDLKTQEHCYDLAGMEMAKWDGVDQPTAQPTSNSNLNPDGLQFFLSAFSPFRCGRHNQVATQVNIPHQQHVQCGTPLIVRHKSVVMAWSV